MASINDLATAAIATSAATGEPAGGEAPAATTPPAGVVRGAFVVFEGLDRSGKTTQVKLLEQRFVELGKKVKVMRFPGEGFLCHGLLYVPMQPTPCSWTGLK